MAKCHPPRQSERPDRTTPERLPVLEADRSHKTGRLALADPAKHQRSPSPSSSHTTRRPSRPGDPPPGRQHAPGRARVMPLPGGPVHPAEKLPVFQERRHRAPLLARERAGSPAGVPEQRHPQPRAERRERCRGGGGGPRQRR